METQFLIGQMHELGLQKRGDAEKQTVAIDALTTMPMLISVNSADRRPKGY